MSKKKLQGIDLYGLFGLTINATSSDIKTAYRKRALKCHPDKNPNNPKAAELFLQLTEASEILLDKSSRAEYDKLYRAKEAAKLRHRELDEKRRKLKEELDAREEAHFSKKGKQKSEDEKLQEEIARLRKEGLKLVQDEIRLIQEEIEKVAEDDPPPAKGGFMYSIRISWKAKESDKSNGGYNKEILERIFRKYGDITELTVSSSSNGLALLEFKERQAAELAMKIELGLSSNPLKLEWFYQNMFKVRKPEAVRSESLINERDYESLVLRQMRQAEERKRLIEQMQNEND